MWVSRDTAAYMAILICHIYLLTSLRYSTVFEVSVSKIAVVQWFESSTHQSNKYKQTMLKQAEKKC